MTIAVFQSQLNMIDINIFNVEMDIIDLTEREMVRGNNDAQLQLQQAQNFQGDQIAIDMGDAQIAPHAALMGGTVTPVGGAAALPANNLNNPAGFAIPAGAGYTVTYPDGRTGAVTNGTGHAITVHGGWQTRNPQTGAWQAYTPPAGQNVVFDPQTGSFRAPDGTPLFQKITVNGQDAYVSGRRRMLPKQDAIRILEDRFKQQRQEGLQDKLRMNSLNTKLEMLNKQREKVMGWVTKAIESWFKGPGDRG